MAKTIKDVIAAIPPDIYSYYLGKFPEDAENIKKYEGSFFGIGGDESKLNAAMDHLLTSAMEDAKKLETDNKATVAEAQKKVDELTAKIAANTTSLQSTQEAIDRLEGVSSSADRKAKALTQGSVGSPLPKDVKQMDPDQYRTRLCYEQPYTDSNGFEQIAGFPWGRNVQVASAAEDLRLEATSKRFSDMHPQVISSATKQGINKGGSADLPDQTTTGSSKDEATAISQFSADSLGVLPQGSKIPLEFSNMTPGLTTSAPGAAPGKEMKSSETPVSIDAASAKSKLASVGLWPAPSNPPGSSELASKLGFEDTPSGRNDARLYYLNLVGTAQSK